MQWPAYNRVLRNLTDLQIFQMNRQTLGERYRSYISCLNRQEWPNLGCFVATDVVYNGKQIGLSGYHEMLLNDFKAIPDLYFDIQILILDPPLVASRLVFNCTPIGELFGLPVNGRRVSFEENVFYEFIDQRISRVWSVIDKSAIEAQL